MVKKLLRSLDSSFDTLALMIQERADYKSLDPADILERLNTHEFQLVEKRDLYGSSYGRSHALKANASLNLKVKILVVALVILKN